MLIFCIQQIYNIDLLHENYTFFFCFKSLKRTPVYFIIALDWFCTLWSTVHAYMQPILVCLDNKLGENLTYIVSNTLFFFFILFFAPSNLRHFVIIKNCVISNFVQLVHLYN